MNDTSSLPYHICICSFHASLCCILFIPRSTKRIWTVALYIILETTSVPCSNKASIFSFIQLTDFVNIKVCLVLPKTFQNLIYAQEVQAGNALIYVEGKVLMLCVATYFDRILIALLSTRYRYTYFMISHIISN